MNYMFKSEARCHDLTRQQGNYHFKLEVAFETLIVCVFHFKSSSCFGSCGANVVSQSELLRLAEAAEATCCYSNSTA
eukprot:2151681-Amphidinium_carterae.1